MTRIFSAHDISNAVSTNFIEYLKTLGFQPVSEKPDRALFHSPLREDRHASFSVGLKDGRWLWHDFATGESADLIAFVQRYHQIPFRDAVTHLLTHAPVTLVPRQPPRTRPPSRTTTNTIKRWYCALKTQQTARNHSHLRHYFTRHHLSWHRDFGSIIMTLHPDSKRPNLTIPYVAFPVPTSNLHDFQALECRALYTVPDDYRRRCLGPKGLWRFCRSGRPLLITESIVDSLAADQLFGPSLDLVALNSIRNIALVPALLNTYAPPRIIVALDHDQAKNRGDQAERDLIELLQPFNIPLSRLTLHHQTAHKDLHKVLLAHPRKSFRLKEYLVPSHSRYAHSSSRPSCSHERERNSP